MCQILSFELVSKKRELASQVFCDKDDYSYSVKNESTYCDDVLKRREMSDSKGINKYKNSTSERDLD